MRSFDQNDYQQWSQVGDGYYVPVVTTVPPMPITIAQYLTYGLIMCLTLLLDYDLLPISPFLILYLIHGFNHMATPTFIHQLAPDSHNSLST